MKQYQYNDETMRYEVTTTSRWVRILRNVSLVILTPASVVFYFWFYLEVLHLDLPKTAFLKKANAGLQAQMSLLDSRLDRCESVLNGVEERNDDVYRSIFGLGEIPGEVKHSGLGGLNRYASLDASGANDNLRQTFRRTDEMVKRAYVQTKALDEVAVVSKKAGDMVSCIPAVPPILPQPGTYHLSSPFGNRIDPVHGGRRFHEGIDLASSKGNPVYCTGNGVVVKVDFKFSGYGNEVVVDHGFGYKTRYAHLKSILVGVGQNLSRGDMIGELGNSGKSTGPHLHYEVLYKGAPVNPRNFMDLDMPVEEYKAMTDRRREESTPVPTTYSDILRRSTRSRQ